MNFFMISFLFYFYINSGNCLWKRGIVHYAVNNKDYDYHSQDIIASTFQKIQREICVKFFKIPMNYSANEEDKILYISNPDKRKDCPAEEYDFDATVVDMKIGYKCLNEHAITKTAVEMLRASVRTQGGINNLDSLKEGNGPSGLLSWKDRNFINYHYNDECGMLVLKAVPVARKSSANYVLTEGNDEYYKEKIWPLGIVIYSMDKDDKYSTDMDELRRAMTRIEVASCIIFHELDNMAFIPKNILWFSSTGGEEMPRLGLMKGNQSLHLPSMIKGDPGHAAHTLNLLFRILGVPMMSNRYDRDNYVNVHWKNIKTGMEHYLERLPEKAIIRNSDGEIMPYDYSSVTHAPSNYFCADCSLGQQTVSPVQDHLWQRTLSMGRTTDLNSKDIEILELLYAKECQHRFRGQDK